jgi:hypothetical protein
MIHSSFLKQENGETDASFNEKGMLHKANPTFTSWEMRLPRHKLKPEERVNAAVYMSDLCVHVCADSIRDKDFTVTDKELLRLVRNRISFGKTGHREV